MSVHEIPGEWPHEPDGTHVATDVHGPKNGKPAAPPASRRYRTLRLYARGALGQVHVAHDDELNREVALKELQDHCADDGDSRLRFLREAEITAALEHPCIVPVYGRGHRPDGRPFYAMRLMRGESLDAAIRRHHDDGGILSFRELLTRFVSVCNAIAYAHSKGVIHRDLKPGNVMLGEFGETMVVDWGLARHYERPEGDPPSDEAMPVVASPTAATATHAGQVVGTPAYMSPEQASGRPVGPASDVYSLGGILYVILTGQPPLPRGVAPLLILSECDRTPPPPRLLKKGVPAALEAVCLNAMAQDPAKRYGSAAELADDVERYLADEPVKARPEPLRDRWRRWRRRHRSLVTGAVALLLAGVVGLAGGLLAVRREVERTAEQRDQARRAEQLAAQEKARAEQEKDRAERNEAIAAQNFEKAKEALDEAKRNLEQADRNLQLARQAVDECFVLATTEPGMKEEAVAPFRRRLLAAARSYYREFARRKPGDPAFDLDLARNLARLATIEAELGDRDEARRHAATARDLCSALARRPALDSKTLQALADCMDNVSSVLHSTGDLNSAVAVLTTAYALQDRLVRERPDDFRARFELCKMAYNLGMVEMSRDRLAEARTWFDLSLKLGGELLKKHPDNAELLGLHVWGWRGRATLHHREGQYDEADGAYRKGAEWGKKLLKRGSVPADDVRTVATTLSDHAAMLSNRGNSARARPLFLEAIALQELLCQKFPEVRFLNDLGIMTGNLGRVCALLDRQDEEEAAWEKSRRVWGEVVARRPKDERAARMYHDANQCWTTARVKKVDRLIKSGDAAGAAEELERLATVTPVWAGLVPSAAACGRWLKAFEKDAKVDGTHAERMAVLCVSLLQRAKKEGMLDEKALAGIRKEPSFAPMRGRSAFDKLVAEVKTKDH